MHMSKFPIRACLVAALALSMPALTVAQAQRAPAASSQYLSESDVAKLRGVVVSLGPCTNAFFQAMPDPKESIDRFIASGLGPQLKAKVRAVLPAGSVYRDYVAKQPADSNAGVGAMMSVLSKQMQLSSMRSDDREWTLVMSVAYYYQARMAGSMCQIPAGTDELVKRADLSKLAPVQLMPGYTTDAADADSGKVVQCYLGLNAVKAAASEQKNRYAAEHADPEAIWRDAQLVASSASVPDDVKRHLDSLSDLPPVDRAEKALGMFAYLGANYALPLDERFRSQLRLAYHLSRASAGSCPLAPSALQFLNKAP